MTETRQGSYKCAVCKITYEYAEDWSEADAQAEMKDNFGEDMEKDDCGVVCDDCYKTMFGGSDA